MSGVRPDDRPGTAVRRLARLVDDAVGRCALDLSGVSVLTEAATGAYAVTPVVAARAGARVVAVTRSTAHGTAAQVREQTDALSAHLGVADRITVVEQRNVASFAAADLVTNSGHLRPIVGEYAAALRADAALSLMFEAWEIQAGRLDVDLAALVGRGVRVAGTNERHPDVDVFGFLGPMAVAQLADAGISARHAVVAVLCDNTFADHLTDGLRAAGAQVRCADDLEKLLTMPDADALVVAQRPTGASVLSEGDLRAVAARWPDVVVTQFWGDVDRALCTAVDVACWPAVAPAPGHMGVLMSRTGPEPVVRLQTAGLKVGQVLLTPADHRSADDLAYLDPLT